MEPMMLGDRPVGQNAPVLIIAEAGVNHNGDMGRARELVDAAAEAGADMIKFQSFVAEELVTGGAPKAGYQQLTTDPRESQLQMLKALELSAAGQADLIAHCSSRGIAFLSTPYGESSIDLLTELGAPAFKIASTDTTNLPFLRYVAATHKPVILSTGMCSLGEVEAAVGELRRGGLENFALLHCTSQYPAPLDEVNLRAIATMQLAFGCPVGFSDHTRGIGASPWAVAVGACIIEKHFTLDRRLPGPDHAASLEPDELAELVRTIREVETALGDGIKRPMPSELPNKPKMQKSLVARRAIGAGEEIDAAALTCKRPGNGLAPRFWDDVVGRRAARPIEADEVLTLGSVNWD